MLASNENERFGLIRLGYRDNERIECRIKGTVFIRAHSKKRERYDASASHTSQRKIIEKNKR